MFQLTPQEKAALGLLLTVCLLGAFIQTAVSRDINMFTWVKAVNERPMRKAHDINAASVKELEKLPGVGTKTAQAIVQYRNQHGSFISYHGLRHVPGITRRNFKKIEEYLLSQGRVL